MSRRCRGHRGRDEVRAEVGDRVRAGRHRRPAVPPQVDAEDAELAHQRRQLRLPHPQRGPERVRQQEHRRIRGPVHRGMKVDRRRHPRSAARAASARSTSVGATPTAVAGSRRSSAMSARGSAASRRCPPRDAPGSRGATPRPIPCPRGASASAATRPASGRRRARAPGPSRRGWSRRTRAPRGARDGRDRRDRVALVGHRRRAAAPRHALADLADLRLGQQHDVLRRLRDRAGRHPEGGRELGDPRPFRVPGDGRCRQPELVGERRDDGRAGIPEPVQRADGAAELHRQRAVDRRPGRRRPGPGRPSSPRPSARTSSAAPAGAASVRRSACRGGGGQRGGGVGGASRRRPGSAPTAREATSTIAVSMTSWLVAPRWTASAAGSPTSDGCAPRGATTGVPVSAASRPISSTSNEASEQARAMASATSWDTSPTRASARTSATSTSTIAASRAASPVSDLAGPRWRTPPSRPP